MSSKEGLLPSLFFTRSTGRKDLASNAFFDVITVGKYPSEERIVKIVQIIVYGSIDGLKVTYLLSDGRSVTVDHGNVSGSKTGELDVSDNELLVGVSGYLKSEDGHISDIQFVVYDRVTGIARLAGPFGQGGGSGDGWGSYGPILALEGTIDGQGKLGSIGFTRQEQGIPSFGILEH